MKEIKKYTSFLEFLKDTPRNAMSIVVTMFIAVAIMIASVATMKPLTAMLMCTFMGAVGALSVIRVW